MAQSPDYDPNRLNQQAEALSVIAASPELRKILAEIAAAPPEERLETAERIASVEALKKAGVAIPEGLRIATRYFENPNDLIWGDVMMNPEPSFFSLSGGGTTCVSVGEIVCVSYGWEPLQ